MDKKKIERAVRMILEAIGENPERAGILKTPSRFARMCEEIFSGIREKPENVLSTLPAENYREVILIRDIPFYSICEHHLLPFFGRVHIAYIPSRKIAGLSKFARLVEVLSRRLQVQERFTNEISFIIQKNLKPRGILVIVEAEHLCMSMRGVKKEKSRIITISTKGIFSRQGKSAQVLNLIKKENAYP